MEKYKFRQVDKHLYINFLRRSEECLKNAKRAFDNNEIMSAPISAVHCCIAALDALCVNHMRKRHAGYNHEDGVKFIYGINTVKKEDLETIGSKAMKVIKMKNMAEYEERIMKPKEAEKMIKDAEYVLEMVKKCTG
ncbi:MAG: HEPN domain protein [Candidatus Aerophobetes bacterium ADurb.Bin490]|nr:MAG: HEPN domain protein [Candidatus Aerophobetes bacterium ADurb.Bin490]HPI04538.1 HEPN domain-containing protein [Candidatus Goldiibacteriota bacterium]